MNAEQKDQIRQLHSSGLGYKKIAVQLGLSAVWAFCCADTTPKTETILFHTMPQHLVESPCCIEERQITAALPYLQRAVFRLSQFAPKILFPSLLWEAQKGNDSWKKNITIRSLRIKPQFRF